MAVAEQKKRRSGSRVTAEQWAARAFHWVMLPSGVEVKIRLPDLSRLLKNDMIPDRLRSVALKQAFNEVDMPTAEPIGGDDAAKQEQERLETAKELAELLDALVLEMVVEPKLSPEQLAEIPAEDRDLLVMIAQRERDTDAMGRRLGVEPLSRWESFRRLHECAEGCPACEALRREFSTGDR